MMGKTVSIIVSTVLNASLFFLSAAQATAQQEELSVTSVPHELSDLQLDDARRVELEDALKQRDYKHVETILVKESERDPKSLRAAKLLVLAGGIFFLDGQYLNSAIAWKKAEAIAPLDTRSSFTLAMAYIKLDRRDWARQQLEKLSTAEPLNSLYLYWLARLDYDGQNYTSAIARLNKVVELDPRMMRAYDLLGLCYDYLGQIDTAIKNYNRAIELNRLQAKPSPWPHLDLAITLIAANQLADAEKNLQEALRYDSRLPQAHYQLGRMLEMEGKYQDAVQSLQQAATLNPLYPEPHYLLGRIYQKLGQTQLAKSHIERFQELDKQREVSLKQGASPAKE
jgi:tetratricopeptide (TPR) repeat protein